MPELSIMVVGRLETGDPLAAGAAPSELRVHHVDHCVAAQRRLEEMGIPPQLIVLSQSRPGEFSAAAIDRLRRLAPLARFWRVLGSWCEGESRSGHPPAGCLNSYAHQWSPRWAHELAAARAGTAPAWALPVTLSNEERALVAVEPLVRRAGLIAICSRAASAAGVLVDVCRRAGYSTRVVQEHRPWHIPQATAIVWDTEPHCIIDRTAVDRIRQSAPTAALVALVNFPRPDDRHLAARAGVTAVVSKPYQVQDLLHSLDGSKQTVGDAAWPCRETPA
jgi:CheY-like chemotaxis protein